MSTSELRTERLTGRSVAIVVLVALALTVLIVARSLSAADWNLTLYIAVGEDDPGPRQYAEERLNDVYLRNSLGHDGRFFFIQANDPWLLDTETNAAVLDRPTYRSQRMLYPVVASLGGALGPDAVVVGMLAVNVVAMGLGTWATALVASRMGMSTWWGLAFALNPGFVNELNIGGAGVAAAAAAFGAVALILRNRNGSGVFALTLAALAREAMLIAGAGTGWWLWRQRRDRRTAVLAALLPLLGVGVWAIYVRWRLGWPDDVSQIEEIGLPFVGFIQAFETWSSDPAGLVIGLVMMLLMLAFVRRVVMSTHLVGWAFVGFVVLGVMFTEQVWVNYYDITRAIAPVFTAYLLLLFAPTEPSDPPV